jgi:AcrR family transcriptional regulator
LVLLAVVAWESGRMNTATEPRWRRLEPDTRREQILACAIELFGERPFAAVSTTDIANSAGVARGLINHYFGTKRDLYLEVVRRMVTMPSTAAETLCPGPIEARIDASVSWFLDRVLRHSKTWLVAVGAAGVGHDPELERILAEADERAADQVLAAVGLADVSEGREQLRAMIRAYGGMVKAAAREWLLKETLSREQVHLLLSQALLTLVTSTLPTVNGTPRTT